MNIFGRVFGGLLVLISLGWLATIVGIRPGWFGSNQINSSQGTPSNSLTATPAVGTVPAGTATGKNQASSFDAKNSAVKAAPNSAASPKAEVEKNPRSATPQPDKAVPQTAPAAPAAPQSAPAAAAPVSAGW
jgi:predicted lipid-binding transport protein (Tim44 family)